MKTSHQIDLATASTPLPKSKKAAIYMRQTVMPTKRRVNDIGSITTQQVFDFDVVDLYMIITLNIPL